MGKFCFDVSEVECIEIMCVFYEVVEMGNVEIVESFLIEFVEMWFDGGGKVIVVMNVVYGVNNIV